MKRKIIPIVFVISLLLGICTNVFADDIEELQNRKHELQNQITESNELIQEIKLNITENLEQLNNLNDKIAGYENDIAALQADLEKLQNEIKGVEDKLKIVQENYNAQRTALQNRIVALYESGDIIYLDVLLNSNSLSDFITNYYLIGEIARYDNNLLEDIEKQKVQIEETKKALEQKQKNAKSAKENAEKTTIALENARIIRNSYIEKLTEQEKETQTKIEEYQTELNNIETRIVALATTGQDLQYVGRRICMAIASVIPQ